MKKIFSLLIVVAMSVCASAQDVILTKDSKKIDAKILEVSKSEIKYKKFNYQDGPTFILETREISSIIYSNGEVVLYDQDTEDNKKESNASIDTSTTLLNIDVEEGDKYVSEDGQVILVYDKDKKQMYLYTNKPLMHNSYDVRNITLTVCHFGDKQINLIFDLANKVRGIAILSGINSFMSNLEVQKYFKKNMPQSFVIDIPYETQQESYLVKLVK